MWYVNYYELIQADKLLLGFILTMWYVNATKENIIKFATLVLY